MEGNIHKGHRNRVKQEFLTHGFDASTPLHKMLELLLFFCLPQGDTNPLAHALENRYHTLAGVLEAPVEELITFPGLTESNVVLLKLILPLARTYQTEQKEQTADFNSFEEIGEYLLRCYFGITEERLGLLCLDGKCRFLGFQFLETGDITSVGMSTRKMIEYMLKTKATCAVMAHNHPRGIALPSEADVAVTRTAIEAAGHIGVKLLDHLVIAGDDYISMAQSRQYHELFYRTEPKEIP